MNWKLKQTKTGRLFLAVEYDSTANNWSEAIAAGLAGSGMKREHLACVIAAPAAAARANFETISGEGLLF